MNTNLSKQLASIPTWIRLAGVTGAGVLLATSMANKPSAKKQVKKEEEGEEKIAPGEDLMREHGVLNRVLLVYDESSRRLASGQDLKPEVISDAAALLRQFIEDYHEKLEENYLFPRFERAGTQTALVKTLRQQHEAGRAVTDRILRLATNSALKNPAERAQLRDSIQQYVRMYRPHEAREDTILFPAFRKLVTSNEYDSLGEQFEKQEHQLLGDDGFEKIVNQVAELEKALDIHDLKQFTPD